MEILRLEKINPASWELELADGRCYTLDNDCVYQYALADRVDISPETLKEMQTACCQRKALQQALRWLHYAPYTYKAMFQRLSPIFGEEISFFVMGRLTEMGLINDVRYAQQLARSSIERKGYGLRRTQEQMLQKGVPKNVIAKVLSGYAGQMEERLLAVIEQKYAKKLTNSTNRAEIEKVKAALVRRGYGFSEIQAAMARYWERKEEMEEIEE